MSTFFANYPTSGAAAGSNPSVGPNGTPAPTESTEIGFIDNSGNLQGVSSSNPLPVTIESEVGTLNVNVAEYGGVVTSLGQKASASSQPVVIASDQSAIPISATALPLPTGAATSANQTNGNQVTQITGTVPLPTGAATATNQATQITAEQAIQANQTNGTQTSIVTQATAANLNARIVGLGTAGTPSGGVVSVQGVSGGTALPTTSTQLPSALGNQAESAGLAITPTNATTVTTAAFTSSTGTLSTEMLTGATNGWYDAAAFNQMSFTIYTTSTVTGGALTFYATDDTTNAPTGVLLNVQDESVVAQSTTLNNLTLAANTIKYYRVPLSKRYVRILFSTAFTGTGTVGLTATFKQTPYAPYMTNVVNSQAANLLVNVATISSTQSLLLTGPIISADVPSGAITSGVTNSSVIQQTPGLSGVTGLLVTAVSGTNPTLDVEIQESADQQITWYAVYDFPRMTAAGTYYSPPLPYTTNVRRYVQTVGGTGSPSFTRIIYRQETSSYTPAFKQIIDRTIVPTTTGSTTAVLQTLGCTSFQMIVNQGTGGSSVVFALDGSNDNVNWVQNLAYAAGVVGGATPVDASYSDSTFQYIRARVVTGVASTTITSVTLSATAVAGNTTRQTIYTDRSGTTSATPSTSTQVAAANQARRYFIIQNLSTTATIYINFTSAAATTGSLALLPSGSYVMESSVLTTEAVNVFSTVASVPFAAKEG